MVKRCSKITEKDDGYDKDKVACNVERVVEERGEEKKKRVKGGKLRSVRRCNGND